jgi:hypothetical protein
MLLALYILTWLGFLAATLLFGWAIVFLPDFRKDVLGGQPGVLTLAGITVRGATIVLLLALFLVSIFKLSGVINDENTRDLNSRILNDKSLLDSKISQIAADQDAIKTWQAAAKRLIFRPVDEADIPYCGLSTEPTNVPPPRAVPRQDSNGRPNLALLAEAQASTSSLIPMMPPGERESVASRHRTSYANDGWYNNCRSWIAATMPAWVQIDLGNVYEITGVAFGSEHDPFYKDRAPLKFKVLFTSGAADWKVAYESTKDEPVQVTTVFNFVHPVSARIVRLLIEDSTPPIYPKTSPGAVRVDELEIYGTPANK